MSELDDTIEEMRKTSRNWPRCAEAPKCAVLADWLGSRVDQVYALLVMYGDRPPLELVVDWLETVAHGMAVYEDGYDPHKTLTPRQRGRMERVSEAFERSLKRSLGTT